MAVKRTAFFYRKKGVCTTTTTAAAAATAAPTITWLAVWVFRWQIEKQDLNSTIASLEVCKFAVRVFSEL